MSDRSVVYQIYSTVRNRPLSANRALHLLNDDGCVDVICVACSGGCDSVFLVKYLLDNFKNIRSRLVLLHYNHNLREEYSDGDEDFVRKLSIEKGLKFFSEKLEKTPVHVTEGILRDYRNDFFSRAMRKFNSKILVTGYQKDDVAETLLMRLIRASGISGLSAPREVTVFSDDTIRIRPLVDVSKSEIKLSLTKSGIKWREDASNVCNDFFRNKIRNLIIPKLQKFSESRNVIDSLCLAKKNIEEADDAIEYFANKIFEKNICGKVLDCHDLNTLPVAVQRRIFEKYLQINAIEVRRSYTEKMIAVVAISNSDIFSAGDHFVKFDGKKIRAETSSYREDWCVTDVHMGKTVLPTGRYINIEAVNIEDKDFSHKIKNIDVAKQCYASISGDLSISIKSFRPNYRYKKFGHNSCKKLADLLPSYAKRRDGGASMLPVIFVNDKICWVPNLPVADDFRLDKCDKMALLLTYF